MTLLTGIVYPVFITGLAQLAFPGKANGSLIIKDGKIRGSKLIGQKFDSISYFWSRPSAIDYKPIPSGASNLGPMSTELKNQVNDRRRQFLAVNYMQDNGYIPAEMLFASASGLDPHASPDAVLLQVNRITQARHFDNVRKQKLYELIEQHTEKPQFGILGEERINIFLLNMDLDGIK